MVFDVPRNLARAALSRGLLVFPEDAESSVSDSSKLGAIRLARVSRGASASAPSAETLPA